MASLGRPPSQMATGQSIVVDVGCLAPLLQEINSRLQRIESNQAELAAVVTSLRDSQDVAKERLHTLEDGQELLAAECKALAVNVTSIIEDDHVMSLLKHDTVLKYRERKLARTITAASRTFKVTEILEQILLNLPMRDLLLAERVDKQFQRVIADSHSIQRALFLKAAPAFCNGKIVTPVANPMVEKQMRSTAVSIVIDQGGTPEILQVSSVKAIHPPRTLEYFEHPCYSQVFEVSIITRDIARAQSASEVIGSTWCHAKGSWQRMFATQPPCQWTFKGGDKVVGHKIGRIFNKEHYLKLDTATVEDCKRYIREGVDLAYYV